MLDINKSRFFETHVANVHSSIGAIEEGSALVYTLEGGQGVVKPSEAAAAQKYAGCALGRSGTPTIVPFFELKAVPATGPYTVTLSKTLSGSAIRVTHIAANGTRTTLVVGDPSTTAGAYSISNGVITVHSGKASGTLELSYRYAITLQEAIFRYNFSMNGSHNVTDIGTIGVVTTGVIFTDRYDVASDWSTYTGAAPVYITADGLYTMTSSGNTEISAAVVSVPSASNMFLGLHVNP